MYENFRICMPYFQTETFGRGSIEKFCGKHVYNGRTYWHCPPYQFTSKSHIHKVRSINCHYFRTFPYSFTFLVFHPYYGTKPAFRSNNVEDDIIQYPLFCIYDNIDRYYGMKSLQVYICVCVSNLIFEFRI